MEIGDFFAGLFMVTIVVAVIALMVLTTMFFISVGVWPIVAWGWFSLIVLGGSVSFAVAADL